MTADAVREVLAREPRTLRELEAALGFSLHRDPSGEDAWLVRRKAPAPGIDFIYVALVGRDLPATADPMLDELRFSAKGADFRAMATAVLGEGELRGGKQRWSPYSAGPTKEPTYRGWRRTQGDFTVHDDASWLFWARDEAPFADAWPPDEEAATVARLRAALGGPLDEARIEAAFGRLIMSGRHPERFLRGPTWKLVVRPIQGPIERVSLKLSPALPLDPLLLGLGFSSMIVRTDGVHQSFLHVADATTRDAPVVHSTRVEIRVKSIAGARPSPIVIPTQRAFETEGLLCDGVDLTPLRKR